MANRTKPQQDIPRTLKRLLPVMGAPKDLEHLRDQLRQLHEIKDPNDERLALIIVQYFRNPRFSEKDERFLKLDQERSDLDLSARWTRARVGPRVWKPAPTAAGDPPDKKLISARMPLVIASHSRSGISTFYLWDLLKEHFGVTSDNNRYYREWLAELAAALSAHPEFVVVGIDDETDLAVEWMLATDRQGQIDSNVARRVPELIGWMHQAEDLVHPTRDLVHRFFSPEVVDDTYDIHAYYRAVSKTLADTRSIGPVWLRERDRQIEAWYLKDRVQRVLEDRLDAISDWLRATDMPQSLDAITKQILQPHPSLASADAVREQVSDALSSDLRFVFDSKRGHWHAVPAGPQENLPVYHVLWEQGSPLSETALAEKIRTRFSTPRTRFHLADDERFSRYTGETWGLSQWVDVGDWAFNYLQTQRAGLPARTIKNQACKALDITPDLVVFIPEADPRFVRGPDGRWRCRHALSDSEVDLMLDALGASEDGLTINELVARAIGLDAQDTDALARLRRDERFVLLKGRWFARTKVAYALTDQDLEQLLKALHQKGTGLRLTTLVQEVLGRQAHLTDAEEKLLADSRFREIAPGVWAPADFEPPAEERVPVFNRPVRSEEVSVLPEEEYTEVEDLTEREVQPRSKTAPPRRLRITRTLSLLDVRHGNLVLSRDMARLLPQECEETIQFTDELGGEFTVWLDREKELLHGLGGWFEARRLTFGDKVAITGGDQSGLLQIEPTGERDDRVYKEALQRQDIDKLRRDALESGKSYHDLMIEVMESINQAAGKPTPIHREDIYELVDYRRTASRDYVFSLLSLTDCPYEELRYFVPHGRGYWAYDPERRRAFEMKMNQLVEQVENLQSENDGLHQELTSVRDRQRGTGTTMKQLTAQSIERAAQIAELSAENARLSETVDAWVKEKSVLIEQADHLRALVSDLEEQVARQENELETVRSEADNLRRQLETTSRERDELRDALVSQQREIEALKKEIGARDQKLVALRGRAEQAESHGADAHAEVERLQTQVDSLLSENAALRQQCDQAKAAVGALARESRESEDALRQELESERRRVQEVRARLEDSEKTGAITREQSVQLSSRMNLVRSGLRTPLGKAYVALQRIMGGPNLSDL